MKTLKTEAFITNCRIFSNLIRTSFCRFLKRGKSWFAVLICTDGEDKDDSDWVTDSDSVMSYDGECDE
jgi:hypothetical protein